jgi:hypothetical protein
MRLRSFFLVVLWVLVPAHSNAQGGTTTGTAAECALVEPASVQISWDAPCTEDNWLYEPTVGCRMWDWHPGPSDIVTWTGQCQAGLMVGRGVLQWSEHGQLIDRFEGAYVAGKRQGQGRYRWNEDNWFIGSYSDDVPEGPGTAQIAGYTFTGPWQGGCLTQGAKTVAIGVPLKSCPTSVHQAGAGGYHGILGQP